MKKIALGFLLAGCASTVLAEQAPDEMERQYEMALTFYESGDYFRAYQLTTETAKKGHPGAQMLLGTMYKDGRGV